MATGRQTFHSMSIITAIYISEIISTQACFINKLSFGLKISTKVACGKNNTCILSTNNCYLDQICFDLNAMW